MPRQTVMEGVGTAIVVMSDRASSGVYEDKSGLLLADLLREDGAYILEYKLIPDNADMIADTLRLVQETHRPKLIIASGGTGPGPRDVTPEVLDAVCDRILEGFGEILRRESAAYTDTAWLSRMKAGMLNETLIVALPGSPKAVGECWEILRPFMADLSNPSRK